jgi:hypothetical protein
MTLPYLFLTYTIYLSIINNSKVRDVRHVRGRIEENEKTKKPNLKVGSFFYKGKRL